MLQVINIGKKKKRLSIDLPALESDYDHPAISP